jgi:hypothetical protein
MNELAVKVGRHRRGHHSEHGFDADLVLLANGAEQRRGPEPGDIGTERHEQFNPRSATTTGRCLKGRATVFVWPVDVDPQRDEPVERCALVVLNSEAKRAMQRWSRKLRGRVEGLEHRQLATRRSDRDDRATFGIFAVSTSTSEEPSHRRDVALLSRKERAREEPQVVELREDLAQTRIEVGWLVENRLMQGSARLIHFDTQYCPAAANAKPPPGNGTSPSCCRKSPFEGWRS